METSLTPVAASDFHAEAWEALCVRCDGKLVTVSLERLCGICETGPVPTEAFLPASNQHHPGWSLGEADEIVVGAILDGHRFEGPLWAERQTAAIELMRRRPDLTRREVGEWCGLHPRSITRLVAREHRKGMRSPDREDVIERLMAGRHNRLNPTPSERGEACRRLIRQGAGDKAASRLVGVSVSTIAGHRHRMRNQEEASCVQEA